MTELFEAQKRLQAEANEVVADLQLDELLGSIGQPIRVGSSAMGLMVRRDIDITIICPRLDAATLKAFADIGAGLMQKTARVAAVRFRNDTGAWNAEPAKYPDGLYLGLTVRAANEAIWTFDIWAVDQPERQPDLAHLKNLLPRITTTHREAILRIKQVLADRARGTDAIASALVYEAVVDHDIETLEQFEGWYRDR